MSVGGDSVTGGVPAQLPVVTVEQQTTPRLKHAAGFERGKALCGNLGSNPYQMTARIGFDVNCVVCLDLYRGMDSFQRRALWSLYE